MDFGFEPYKPGQIKVGDEYVLADGVRAELHVTKVLAVKGGRFAYSGPTYTGTESEKEMDGFILRRTKDGVRIMLPRRVFDELGSGESVRDLTKKLKATGYSDVFEAADNYGAGI